MSDPKHFVMREIYETDRRSFAVVSFAQGNATANTLVVHGWHEKESEARLQAHELEYPA